MPVMCPRILVSDRHVCPLSDVLNVFSVGCVLVHLLSLITSLKLVSEVEHRTVSLQLNCLSVQSVNFSNNIVSTFGLIGQTNSPTNE
jgi:hypothetical protein